MAMELLRLTCSVLFILAIIRGSHQTESEADDSPAAEVDGPPGHMQPLGSHMEPKPVTRIDYMPTPQEFHEKFVSPKRPVIFEGLMSSQEVLKNWQNDDYLRTHFGDDLMGTEQRKIENRSLPGLEMTMADFLNVYKDKNIYMVSDLSPNQYDEWRVPRFLLCGGYADRVAMIMMWFSSGGTKSVLHTDTMENLHCLVSGTKKFVMIKPYFAESIGPEHKGRGYFNVDVERVNMTAYPNLTKIPWYLATLSPGDCMYLPYLWIHHVESHGRNLGVNMWWDMFNFNAEDCPAEADILPEFIPLSNFQPEMVVSLRRQLYETRREDGTVHAEDMMSDEFRMMGLELTNIKEFFETIQPGSKGILTNVYNISEAALRKGAEFMSNLFNISSQSDQEDEDSTGEGDEAGQSEQMGEQHQHADKDEL